MAVLTIRSLDEATKAALRLQAAQHGVSMEEEARRILRAALPAPKEPTLLGQRLLLRFRDVADEGFDLPARQSPRTPPAWTEEP